VVMSTCKPLFGVQVFVSQCHSYSVFKWFSKPELPSCLKDVIGIFISVKLDLVS